MRFNESIIRVIIRLHFEQRKMDIRKCLQGAAAPAPPIEEGDPEEREPPPESSHDAPASHVHKKGPVSSANVPEGLNKYKNTSLRRYKHSLPATLLRIIY